MPVRPRLLVTRPTERQEPFGARARALGVEPVPFPCVEIVPDTAAALPDAAMLRAEDLVLFTSRPAVEAFVARRPLPWPGTRLAAIGSATAEALERAGQAPVRAPAPPFTSEALLAELEREPPLGRLTIVRGRGGRGVLEERLRERGTRVAVLELYRRQRPRPDEARRRQALIERPPDLVSVTSDEILDNLVALSGDALDALRPLPLLLNSERCARRAREHGFGGELHVARPAGDEGQLACLSAWVRERATPRASSLAPGRAAERGADRADGCATGRPKV